MRKTCPIALALLVAAGSTHAQELRTNPDGSPFAVSIDPRTKPRMSVDDVVALADEAQRTPESSPKDRTTLRRIDLTLAEEVQLVVPDAPFQESQRGRWVWVVRVTGHFAGGSGPSGPGYEGREGWYLIDDGSGAIYAWGFTKEKPLEENPKAGTIAPSAALAPCQRHYAAARYSVLPQHVNSPETTGAWATWKIQEVNRAPGIVSPPQHAEQVLWVETGFNVGLDWVEVGLTEGQLINSTFGVGEWFYSARNVGGIGGAYSEGHFLLGGQPVQRTAADLNTNKDFKVHSCKRMEPGCTVTNASTFVACVEPIQAQRLCISWPNIQPGTNHWDVGLESTCQGARVDATYVRDSQYRWNATAVNPTAAPQLFKDRPVDVNVDIQLCSPSVKRSRYWMNPLNNKNVCGT